MTIYITPEQQTWINARIERGEFASIEEAVQQFIEERTCECELEGIDNMDRVKPSIDEALAEVERGKFVTL